MFHPRMLSVHVMVDAYYCVMTGYRPNLLRHLYIRKRRGAECVEEDYGEVEEEGGYERWIEEVNSR